MKNRKDEIKSAALELFINDGLTQTTMQEIAKNISIARSTIYEYYSSKEEILFDLLKEIVNQEIKYDTKMSFKEQLIEVSKQLFIRLKSNYQLYKLLFQEMPVLGNKTKKKFSDWQDRSLMGAKEILEEAKHEGLLRTDLNLEKLTFYFKALIGQKMSDFLFNDNEFDPDKEAREVIDILLNGIMRKK